MSVVTPPDGRHVSDYEPPQTVDDSREQAIAALKRKRKFAEDAVAFLSVNGVLWLIWLISDRSTDGSIPWPAWISIIWGFLLTMDAWRTFGKWPGGLHRPITEAEIEAEISRNRR